MKIIGLLFLAAFFLTGCAHPLERQGYSQLEPLPVNFVVWAGMYDQQFMKTLIKLVEKHKDSPEELETVLERLKDIADGCWADWEALSKKMRPGDELYYFKYKDHNYRDSGVLVLRDNEIVYRSTVSRTLFNAPVGGVQHTNVDLMEHIDKL